MEHAVSTVTTEVARVEASALGEIAQVATVAAVDVAEAATAIAVVEVMVDENRSLINRIDAKLDRMDAKLDALLVRPARAPLNQRPVQSSI